MNAHKTLLIK